MHQDSHKIFEAYVLAKRVENQQLNEGIFDIFKDPIKREDEKRLKMYKDLWKRYYYPRFKDPKQITLDKEKAIRVFNNFLSERDWGTREINVSDAINYFKNNFDTSTSFQDLEDNSLKVLLYGKEAAESTAPEKTSMTKTEPPKTETDKVVASAPEPSSPSASVTTMSKSERDSLPKEVRDEMDKKVYGKPETVAPTPAPVGTEPVTEPSAETEEDPYKLKAEITRLKKLNQAWANAIKKKFGRTVRKPSDLAGKPAAKKSVVGKK